MKHFASPRFWACYQELPTAAKELADASFERLKTNPKYSSLHFKKVGPFWSVRVGLHYRALAVETPEGFLWFWIGTHAEYDQLVG